MPPHHFSQQILANFCACHIRTLRDYAIPNFLVYERAGSYMMRWVNYPREHAQQAGFSALSVGVENEVSGAAVPAAWIPIRLRGHRWFLHDEKDLIIAVAGL